VCDPGIYHHKLNTEHTETFDCYLCYLPSKFSEVFFMYVMRNISKRSIGIVILLLLSGVSLLIALDPNKTIYQYGHNVWLRQNGLPANAVYVGLQGRDGYLWLGTSAGLFVLIVSILSA